MTDLSNKTMNKIELSRNGNLKISIVPNPATVVAVKSIPGITYDKRSRCWRVSIEEWGNVKKVLRIQAFIVDNEIEKRYKALLESDENRKREVREAGELARVGRSYLPANGWELRDYQSSGLDWLLENGNKILADDMGLGKTLQSLMLAWAYQKNTGCQCVIVSPLSVQSEWESLAKDLEVSIIWTTWDSLTKLKKNKKYPSGKFILILDEIQYMKGENSKRSLAARKLALNENCLKVIGLSGTPIKEGKPINIFPILEALRHPLGKNKSYFEKRYCGAHQREIERWVTKRNGERVKRKQYFWWNEGAENLNELREKLDNWVLRRTKKEVLSELPDKTRLIEKVQLSPEENNNIQEIKEEKVLDYRRRVEAGEVSEEAEALVTLGYVMEANSMEKIPYTMRKVHELLSLGEQIVIFVKGIKAGGELFEQCSKLASTTWMNGGTSTEKRTEFKKKFQAKETKIFISTIRAGGTGITLTSGRSTIMHDREFSSDDTMQAEDRTWRMGQTKGCFIYWMSSIYDEHVDKIIAGKLVNSTEFFTGKRITGENAKAILEKI